MRVVIISVFFAQLLASVGYYFSEDRRGPPESGLLEFETPELRPDPQPCGTEWRTSVSCRNSGTVPLRILQVGKSCGCTSVTPPENRLLNPGEVAEIQFSIRAGDLAGEKSNVDVLCQYEATESGLKGVARLPVEFLSVCDTPTSVRSIRPVPDSAFGGTDAQNP